MKMLFDSHMGALYAAFKEAKNNDEKMMVIMKYEKHKEEKEFRVFGKVYAWK